MSLIETAIDKAKDLAKLAQKLDNIEIIQQVLDVQSELLKVHEELQALRKENEELKNIEKIDAQLVLRDNAYWQDSAPETRRGPFCMRCWDAERKKVTLVVRNDGLQRCKNCDKTFNTKRYEAADSARSQANHHDSDNLSDPDNTLGTMFGR